METVVDGLTGRLWKGGAAELVAAVRDFDPLAVDPRDCLENARRFDRSAFRERFVQEVDDACRERADAVGAQAVA